MKENQADIIQPMEKRINYLLPILNEKQRRLYLAAEAISDERISVSMISKLSGFSRNTISAGVKELQEQDEEYANAVREIRKSGAGRKKINEEFPGILDLLERLLSERGKSNPWATWCGMSIREILEALKEQGQWIGRTTLANSLRECGYLYYSSEGDLERLFRALTVCQQEEHPVILLELFGVIPKKLPYRVWNFIKKWWDTDKLMTVGTLPETIADGSEGILYCKIPSGYMKWKKRILCATLRLSLPEQEESTCLIWQIAGFKERDSI